MARPTKPSRINRASEKDRRSVTPWLMVAVVLLRSTRLLTRRTTGVPKVPFVNGPSRRLMTKLVSELLRVALGTEAVNRHWRTFPLMEPFTLLTGRVV